MNYDHKARNRNSALFIAIEYKGSISILFHDIFEEKGFSSRSDFISHAIQRQILKLEEELEEK